MNLHSDSPAFETLLLELSERSGLRADILEKDYYVTLLLEELAQKQTTLPAYFKGGTALYKAIHSTQRFSEDVDLTVEVEDCPNNNQRQRRLREAAQGYACLTLNPNDPDHQNHRDSITSIYRYQSVLALDFEDELQRFQRVKVEATSFTISEPHEHLQIAPLIFELAEAEQKAILEKQYQVSPFSIQTIRLERIFMDKVFAAEDYYRQGHYFDVAKHLYDLIILLDHERIRILRSNPDEYRGILEIQRREERKRYGCDLADVPFDQFTIFNRDALNPELIGRFTQMQRIYIFEDHYRLSTQELFSGISALQQWLQNE